MLWLPLAEQAPVPALSLTPAADLQPNSASLRKGHTPNQSLRRALNSSRQSSSYGWTRIGRSCPGALDPTRVKRVNARAPPRSGSRFVDYSPGLAQGGAFGSVRWPIAG